MALGAWGLCAAERAAAAGRALLPGHALDRLRPDQIRAAAAAPPRRRAGRRQRPDRGRHVPRRSCSARSSAAASSCSTSGALVVGGVGVAAAVLGLAASRLIPPAPPAPGGDLPRPRLVARHAGGVCATPRRAPSCSCRSSRSRGSGSSARRSSRACRCFAKDVLFADEHVVTLMLALFAVGVGLGSIARRAAAPRRGERALRAGRGRRVMAFCAVRSLPRQRRPRRRRRARRRDGVRHRRRATCACSPISSASPMAGGLFTVPLYAVLQHESEPNHRARVIAVEQHHQRARDERRRRRRGAVLLDRGLTMGELFALCGIATHPGRPCSRRGSFGVPLAQGGDAPRAAPALPRAGRAASSTRARRMPHAVIAANHASFLDGLLLGAFLPGQPIFAVDTFDRHALVGAAVPGARRRDAGRSDQPAVDSRDDPRRRGRLGLRHLSRRPHHDDRRADEGLRRPGGHRRADRRGAAARAHRGRRVHALLAPRRQGPPALVPARSASASCRRGVCRRPRA